MKAKRRIHKITRALEIPREVSSNIPKITILGFDEMLVENYKSIIEYDEIFIRVATHIGIVDISGVNLKLNQMTDDAISVSGQIDEIEFEKKYGEMGE